MTTQWMEKIYAGFLGMNIGIRLGAPVEPVAWDFDRIASIYGSIHGYLKNYKNFAADDDVNGPVYFLRALIDNGFDRPLTAEAVGEAWLNYTRAGIGMFWWGGEGVSTEHTAFNNLKKGIKAPVSGSIAQNGKTIAEQIGGQIFVDTWGLVCPENPERAAQMAKVAASVSHDGEGLHGAMFIAACIARAFDANNMDEVIDAGLVQIPESSVYAELVHAVRQFHAQHPEDFRKCMRYLMENWGYDKYPGICHIIPNAGVCVLSLLYGEGDFAKTIEIASMCGWDTDCNAGNVGTIAGVFSGIESIPTRYMAPVNDAIVLSGISGYLNILDIPTYAKQLHYIACTLAGKVVEEKYIPPESGVIDFDFVLPRSTHGIRLSNEMRYMKRHLDDKGGCVEIIVDRILAEDTCNIFYKPFYVRDDFDDERYKPVFSPTVGCGQQMTVDMDVRLWNKGNIIIRPYVKTAFSEICIYGEKHTFTTDASKILQFTVPDTYGECIKEIGIHVSTSHITGRVFGSIRVYRFTIDGKAKMEVDFTKQKTEFLQVTPFSFNEGAWQLVGQCLVGKSETSAQAFTGRYYAKDVQVEVDIVPQQGLCHGVIVRAQGARRFIVVGFDGENTISLRSYNGDALHVEKREFEWKHNCQYHLSVHMQKHHCMLYINNKKFDFGEVKACAYGMAGLWITDKSTSKFSNFIIRER